MRSHSAVQKTPASAGVFYIDVRFVHFQGERGKSGTQKTSVEDASRGRSRGRRNRAHRPPLVRAWDRGCETDLDRALAHLPIEERAGEGQRRRGGCGGAIGPPGDEMSARLEPEAERELQAVLDREARRLLAEDLAALDRDPAGATTGSDDRAGDHGPDHVALAVERQPVPVGSRRDRPVRRDDRG
jgi:hypothetical protein